MTRDLDPEVLADQRKRNAVSDRDRDDATPAARPFGSPEPVERWPCSGCGVMVDIPAAALQMHAICNRKLAARGDRTLEKRGQCEACKRREVELEQARRRPHEQRELAVGDERPVGQPAWWREPRRNSR